PVAFVWTWRATLVAPLVTVMLAPATTAPDGSVTVPVISPKFCPNNGRVAAARIQSPSVLLTFGIDTDLPPIGEQDKSIPYPGLRQSTPGYNRLHSVYSNPDRFYNRNEISEEGWMRGFFHSRWRVAVGVSVLGCFVLLNAQAPAGHPGEPSPNASALPLDRGAPGLWTSLKRLRTRASLLM